MKKMSKPTNPYTNKIPVVFFGSGPVAMASLEFILQNFLVEAVITKPATEAEMAELAANIPVYSVQDAAELDALVITQLFRSQLGILVDFGVIVSKKVIDYFPLGIVNSHFSLLPEWRGADPITFSILSGQSKTGVSLMLIDEKMDRGKLIGQKSLAIDPKQTTPGLTEKLVVLSNDMLADYAPRYAEGKFKPHAQPHPTRATYSRKLTKQDGKVDWKKPAEIIEREIRAYVDWPKSSTTLAKKEVIILEAHIIKDEGEPGTSEVKDKKLIVHTAKDSLVIDRLKPNGKNEMSGAEFIRGYMR